MFRLGLRLAVQGGREALVRLLVTAFAVMVGAALLLSVLALFRGSQLAASKPCFAVSDGDCAPVAPNGKNDAVLALYRKDAYKGETITRLDLAKLSNYSITIPGLSQMPAAGEYYTSPAMEALLKKTPANKLDDRYPGKQAGTIGEAGLHSPDELVIIIGREAEDIQSLSGAVEIKAIGAQQEDDSGAAFMRFIAMLGAVALLFPMLILIGSATRLGAARREERYAAFRLVGATPRQVNIIASADAVLGSTAGVVAGIGLFFALQPLLADVAITGSRVFASDVRPTLWQFMLVAAGVPISAAVASFLSLRRVRISPLGVSRKTTPAAPRIIGLAPLVLGAVLFTVAVLVAPSDEPPFAAVPGLALIMVGLVTSGPWLTIQIVRLIARLAHGAAALLAVRRLADNPKAAFRSVSGLVVVVFTASVVAFMAPAVLTQRHSAANDTLSNVLTVEFPPVDDALNASSTDAMSTQDWPAHGLKPAEGKQLVRQLQSISGVKVFPIYNDPTKAEADPGPNGQAMGPMGPPPAIISCDSLEQLAALGTCPAGAKAITITSEAFDDVIVNHLVGSIVAKESEPRSIDTDTMLLRGMLVRADNATALEEARTMLSQTVVMPVNEILLTFGETRESAQAAEDTLQGIISAGVIVTLITAGFSVAVAAAGSLIERRRPFTLLRLSGAPASTLYKVILWEAAVPLISATLVAAAIGFGTAALVILEFAPDSANAHIEMPDWPYTLALIAGPALALIVVCATLPLVGRLTRPDNVRFE